MAMQRDWNDRAVSNALYAIDASRREWNVSEFYARGPQLVAAFVDPVLEHFGVESDAGTVLEIGCGIGRLFPALSERFSKVIGVDVSDKMIELGKELCPVNATWIVGDGGSLTGVESESVLHVLSYEVFQHIPDLTVISDYVAEVRRVLRPGGTFQLHLRKGSDTKRQELIRHLPRSGRVIAGRILQSVNILPVKGDVDTWLGLCVPPEKMLEISRSAGLVDLDILSDALHAVGMGYWIVGRRNT
jgi:SAM-dependent methyltransferase